jgi:hypothetical protein
MFSALAYAQLFPQHEGWYVVLNSTSNWRKLVDNLAMLSTLGITTMRLALDNDPAGHETVLSQILLRRSYWGSCPCLCGDYAARE